jgi:hypothetical protein
MSEIIEQSNDGSTSILEADDGHPQVSLKDYQNIYHQITGRTEKIRQKYSKNLLIEFSEIEQLHFKIMQLCDVHHVIAHNEVISVFHAKERKEQFTSFDRFIAYNSSTTRPTVNIILRYNFSISLSSSTRPQEYIVNINLTSRVALLNQLESEMPSFMRGRFFSLSAGNVAEISVEYADYVVARSFLESFDEWVDGCNATPENKILGAIQQKSHHFPKLLQLALAFLFIYFCINSIPDFFQEGSPPEVWARFLAIFGGGFYIVTTIAQSVGQMLEQAIDSIYELSYLKINKGDEKLINEFSTKSRVSLYKFFIGCLVTISLGIISSKLAALV